MPFGLKQPLGLKLLTPPLPFPAHHTQRGGGEAGWHRESIEYDRDNRAPLSEVSRPRVGLPLSQEAICSLVTLCNMEPIATLAPRAAARVLGSPYRVRDTTWCPGRFSLLEVFPSQLRTTGRWAGRRVGEGDGVPIGLTVSFPLWEGFYPTLTPSVRPLV